MNGPMKKLTISLIVCGLFAFSQQPQRSDALRQIIPGHYLFTSSTYNSGVIATSEGVIVSQLRHRGRSLDRPYNTAR
jgi:hypothetical protein